MRTSSIFFTLALAVSFSSCVTTFKDFDDQAKRGRTPEGDIFLIRNNGEKITGNKITEASVWKAGAWIAIDGKKFSPPEVQAYQNQNAYFVHLNPAVWVQRLRYGKINLYYYDEVITNYNNNDRRNSNKASYVFEKEKGRLQQLGYDNFMDAISDNKEALEKFKQIFPHGRIPAVIAEKTLLYHLIDIVETYNR